jgi:sugar fermentation stimulation protein A
LLWSAPIGFRKRLHTWRAIKHGRTWIGTDTHLANRLVEQTLNHKRLSPLPDFQVAEREPRGPRGTRVDFLLLNGADRCYVEVKNAMIAEKGYARFPDSRSLRACAHLEALSSLAAAGHRAVLLFLVQRGDVHSFRINHGCDPFFTKAYARARSSGVEVLAVKHAVTRRGFGPPTLIPVHD